MTKKGIKEHEGHDFGLCCSYGPERAVLCNSEGTHPYQLSRETLERFADGAVRRTLLPFKILATGVEYFIDQHGKRISSDGKVNTDFPD